MSYDTTEIQVYVRTRHATGLSAQQPASRTSTWRRR